MKTFLLALAVVLGIVAWNYRDSEFVRRFTPSGASLPPSIRFDDDGPRTPGADGQARMNRPGENGLRKCKRGTEILYINGPCPEGSREQSMKAGTVTVMPARKEISLPKPNEQSAGVPNVREMLAPSDEPSLHDRHVDKNSGR